MDRSNLLAFAKKVINISFMKDLSGFDPNKYSDFDAMVEDSPNIGDSLATSIIRQLDEIVAGNESEEEMKKAFLPTINLMIKDLKEIMYWCKMK